MKNLMDLEYGWATLDSSFISKVVQIIASPQALINVCRPATAILKRLVEADPASAPGPLMASSSRSLPAAPPGSVYCYGFDVVFEEMRKESGLLETVINRLGTADTALALNRCVKLRCSHDVLDDGLIVWVVQCHVDQLAPGSCYRYLLGRLYLATRAA
jgi:hypothetical protein